MTIAGAEKILRGHDLAIVIGAQVFRYYPYVAGEYLPEGTDLLQITAIRHWPGRRRSVTVCSATRCWLWNNSWAWSTTTVIGKCLPRRSATVQSNGRRPRRLPPMRCGRPWLR